MTRRSNIGQPSTILARTMIPWLKIFLDYRATVPSRSTTSERRPSSREGRGLVRESGRWCAG
ncbi:hypothetical protein ONO23_03049 [Micromonospora noduli]|nr:hypothetical protein ONO23_03049 [Micromonospora noduli]